MRTESNRFGANTETSKGPYLGVAYRLRQAWGYAWGYGLAKGIVATTKNVVSVIRILFGSAAAVVVLYVLRHYWPPSASEEGYIHHTLMAVSPWLNDRSGFGSSHGSDFSL